MPPRSGNSCAIIARHLSFAPRFDSTRARAAAPSRARRTGSVSKREQRLFESTRAGDLNGSVLGDERLGDLLEVVHVRAEDDRLAEHRRLQDIVPAGVNQAAPDEDGGGDLIHLRQLADRVEHDDVRAGLGVYRQIRALRGDERLVARELRDFREPFGVSRCDARAGDWRCSP